MGSGGGDEEIGRAARTYIQKGGSFRGVLNAASGEEFYKGNESQGRLSVRATPKKREKK